MKIAVLGGVASTEILVRALVGHGFTQIKVWGYEPTDTTHVSGWRDMRNLSCLLKLPFEGFRKVTECEDSLKAFEPDVVFVVGLSQIIPASIMRIATRINVGFHPTALPRGRGRAALAWLILQGNDGAATFFELKEGVDDGPILVQETYTVLDGEDAADVEAKLLIAEKHALDRWLPRLMSGDLSSNVQDHSQATWLGRRAPEDGCINWHTSREHLTKLIRASAPPHPGAFTFSQDHKILLFEALFCDRAETGVTGRILRVHSDNSFEVQAGDGILKITRWYSDSNWTPRVGSLLGYYAEAEIFNIRKRLADLERVLQNLCTQQLDT